MCWALDPKVASQFEGKGIAIAKGHPLPPILLRWLRIVFRGMAQYMHIYVGVLDGGRGGVILAKTTQSRHLFGRFWIFSMLLVRLLLKNWCPPILDVENSKIKVSA